jgi:hypothetical protein
MSAQAAASAAGSTAAAAIDTVDVADVLDLTDEEALLQFYSVAESAGDGDAKRRKLDEKVRATGVICIVYILANRYIACTSCNNSHWRSIITRINQTKHK